MLSRPKSLERRRICGGKAFYPAIQLKRICHAVISHASANYPCNIGPNNSQSLYQSYKPCTAPNRSRIVVSSQLYANLRERSTRRHKARQRPDSIFIASIRGSQRNRCRNAIERTSSLLKLPEKTREIAIGLQLFHPHSKINELPETDMR